MIEAVALAIPAVAIVWAVCWYLKFDRGEELPPPTPPEPTLEEVLRVPQELRRPAEPMMPTRLAHRYSEDLAKLSYDKGYRDGWRMGIANGQRFQAQACPYCTHPELRARWRGDTTG